MRHRGVDLPVEAAQLPLVGLGLDLGPLGPGSRLLGAASGLGRLVGQLVQAPACRPGRLVELVGVVGGAADLFAGLGGFDLKAD
jgi:hypothetical protein